MRALHLGVQWQVCAGQVYRTLKIAIATLVVRLEKLRILDIHSDCFKFHYFP